MRAPPPAAPSQSEVEASAVARQALDYFQRGNFAVAADLYRKAFDADPKPNYLYGVARALQQAGKYAQARAEFAKVLAMTRPAEALHLKAAHQDELARKALDAVPARGHLSDPVAKPEPDRRAPPAAEAKPTPHHEVPPAGATSQPPAAMAAPATSTGDLGVTLAQIRPAPPVKQSSTSVWLAAAVGVAAVGTGALVLIRANTDQGVLNRDVATARGNATYGGAVKAELESRNGAVNRQVWLGWATSGLGATLAGVAGWMALATPAGTTGPPSRGFGLIVAVQF